MYGISASAYIDPQTKRSHFDGDLNQREAAKACTSLATSHIQVLTSAKILDRTRIGVGEV